MYSRRQSWLWLHIDFWSFLQGGCIILALLTDSSTVRAAKLIRCSSQDTKEEINIPTLFLDENGDYEYRATPYTIDQNDHVTVCKDGKHPVDALTSTSIQQYQLLASLAEFPVKIHALATILLENGYLSIGNGSGFAYFYAPDEFCIERVNNAGSNTTVELKICEFSSNRPILNKCCPMGSLMNDFQRCVKSRIGWNISYFDSETMSPVTNVSVNPVYRHVPLSVDCKMDMEVLKADGCHMDFHPLTNNGAVFLGYRRTWDYLDPSQSFCFNKIQMENGDLGNMMIMCGIKRRAERAVLSNEIKEVSYVLMVSMYIGAVFYFLTAVVHLLSWRKQNIHGRTLCSCVAALSLMLTFMGTAHLHGLLQTSQKAPICVVNAILPAYKFLAVSVQYFMICSFTWLLIINIDLWLTLRSIRVESGTNWRRFAIYSGVGWGFPLIVSGFSLILDFTTCLTSRIRVPGFGITMCSVLPEAQGFYIYSILAILIFVSYIFAGMTTVVLYRKKKALKKIRSTREGKENTLLLFLKMSLLMGLNWLFEIITWAAKSKNEYLWTSVAWTIPTVFNSLSAILLFVFFACKKTTLDLLVECNPKLKGMAKCLSIITCSRAVDNDLSQADETSQANPNFSQSTENQPSQPESVDQQIVSESNISSVTVDKKKQEQMLI